MTRDVAHPAIRLVTPAARFLPMPLAKVATEDPALSARRDKGIVWNYPIIRDGLIYVVDIRTGLCILRYRGPYAGEVADLRLLEGNSNLGDATRYSSR